MRTDGSRTMIVAVLLGVFLLAGGSTLYAHFGASGGPGFSDPAEHVAMHSAYLVKKLDLDAAQQQEMETIAQKLLEKGKALHDLHANMREEVVTLLKADRVDPRRVQLLQNRHQEAVNDFTAEAASQMTEFANTLSPEQRQRLAKLIEDHGNGGHSH